MSKIIMIIIITLVRKSSSVWTVSISTKRFILCRQSIGLVDGLDDVDDDGVIMMMEMDECKEPDDDNKIC